MIKVVHYSEVSLWLLLEYYSAILYIPSLIKTSFLINQTMAEAN